MPRTILIVEDDAALRRVAVLILQRAGFRVREATDPDDAVRIANEPGAIDLLLTDVLMPGMSGIALATMIRQFRPGLPILFMSGHPVRTISGVADFVAKPFGPPELLEAVDRIFQRTDLS